MARSLTVSVGIVLVGAVLAMTMMWLRAAGQRDVAFAELETYYERGRAAALAEHLRRSQMIEDMLRSDTDDLMARLEAIALRARDRVTVFRDRVVQAPPAQCAPGQDFVDAVNEALR